MTASIKAETEPIDTLTYKLVFLLKSNGRPYTTIYELIGPIGDDDAAKHWARTMAAEMGKSYTVMLLKNGNLMAYTDDEHSCQTSESSRNA